MLTTIYVCYRGRAQKPTPDLAFTDEAAAQRWVATSAAVGYWPVPLQVPDEVAPTPERPDLSRASRHIRRTWWMWR